VLVFTPDRLAVVKGSPAIRRRYLDRMISRLSPSKAVLPAEYGAALAQRNAALRRVRAGLLERDAVDPWTEAVARLGDDLERARGETVAVITPRFSEEAEVLGLAAAGLRYQASEVTVDALEERLERDIQRGTTGIGPHLQDVELTAAGTELRTYGSQGQQRVAMLALLLAELRALSNERAETPLLLLDDVLSELDDGRRRALLNSVPSGCQVLVTSTTERAVPADAPAPAQVIEVAAGTARQR
jgi:DNA replication and repair protein RecF